MESRLHPRPEVPGQDGGSRRKWHLWAAHCLPQGPVGSGAGLETQAQQGGAGLETPLSKEGGRAGDTRLSKERGRAGDTGLSKVGGKAGDTGLSTLWGGVGAGAWRHWAQRGVGPAGRQVLCGVVAPLCLGGRCLMGYALPAATGPNTKRTLVSL